MRRIDIIAGLLLATALPALAAPPLSIEQIMANPDWIGHAVESPYWSADGSAVYYRLKRDGSSVRDLYRVDLATGESVKVTDKDRATADGRPLFNHQHDKAAFLRHGDVFVRDLASDALRQITRTAAREQALQWSADGRAVQYKVDQNWFSHDLATGTTSSVAVVKAEDNPYEDHPDALARKQLRLFKTLRDIKSGKNAQRTREIELDRADATRADLKFWLGKKAKIVDTELSPDGKIMLVVTEPAAHKSGRPPVVNRYVTESGYGKAEDARIYVGRNDPAPQSLWLLDLAAHAQHKLDLGALPGIHDDPLKALRDKQVEALRQAGHDKEADAIKAPEVRAVRIADEGPAALAWSDDGKAVAVMFRAVDNKDRWIASIDFDSHKLVPQQRLHDTAWINWNFNDFGFIPHGHVLWYLSEESGFSHLYRKALDGKAEQLTRGTFEISHPQLSADGQWFYVRSNQQAPYAYDVFRLPAAGGKLQRITAYQGMNDFALSPDGKQLLVTHSSAYLPPQLAVIRVDGSGGRELTDTRKPAYKAMQWIEPEFVQVPSSHGNFKVHAKLYKAADFDPAKPHPAVFFVHGAGYTQDVTKGWSYYFREQMFNNLLAHEGYVVLDMDYRASEGYGRDWRTAIYRNMGHPELEDLLDGKAWLVRNYHVDPQRVGIYGGSYGGFMTEIALLRAPGEFAAGAAVRPVSDWSDYNHEYTSNILNDPQIDPEAYRRSSPIEYAKNLADPLLMCHGLIDNNVLPDDTIRLYQRFIELHKTDFWMSLYPLERHAFEHADSWHDEYRRIHALFTRFVKGSGE